MVATLQLADRASAATMRANQVRLWIDAMGYDLMCRPSAWSIRPSPRPLVA